MGSGCALSFSVTGAAVAMRASSAPAARAWFSPAVCAGEAFGNGLPRQEILAASPVRGARQ